MIGPGVGLILSARSIVLVLDRSSAHAERVCFLHSGRAMVSLKWDVPHSHTCEPKAVAKASLRVTKPSSVIGVWVLNCRA